MVWLGRLQFRVELTTGTIPLEVGKGGPSLKEEDSTYDWLAFWGEKDLKNKRGEWGWEGKPLSLEGKKKRNVESY